MRKIQYARDDERPHFCINLNNIDNEVYCDFIVMLTSFQTISSINYEVTKSLVVKIDENLSWNFQVNQVTKKVNAGLSILRRLREIVDYRTLITIYQSIIQPHFDYCSQVWGCLGKGLSDKLQKLQN